MYPSLKHLDLETLLRLRLAFDTPELYHNIDQDIQDLYAYPERLIYTYPKEWRIFIRQQLARHSVSEQDFEAFLNSALESDSVLADLLEQTSKRFEQTLAIVNEVQAIETSAQVTAITPPLKRKLKQLLND